MLLSPKALQRSFNKSTIKTEINERILSKSICFDPIDRYCSLIFDEMCIQPHLDINVRQGCINGLEDFGSGKLKSIADQVHVCN